MIQRIQTIFLLLALICLGLVFYFPFAMSTTISQGFLSDGDFDIYDNIFLIILSSLGALSAGSAIFLFKNRPLQLRLSYFIAIFSLLLLFAAIIIFYNEAKEVFMKGEIKDSFGLFLPVLSIIFGILASFFIRKDEKVVRSMDRLR